MRRSFMPQKLIGLPSFNFRRMCAPCQRDIISIVVSSAVRAGSIIGAIMVLAPRIHFAGGHRRRPPVNAEGVEVMQHLHSRSSRRFQPPCAAADALKVPALDQCADRCGDILHRHAERVGQLCNAT
jgi:hypothetical protein